MDRLPSEYTANGHHRSKERERVSNPTSIGLEIDIIGLLLRRWPAIALSLVLCFALAVFYFLIATPKYESIATVMIAPKNAAVSASGSSFQDRSNAFTEDVLATHMMVLQSPRIVQTALETNGDDSIEGDGLWLLPSLVNAVADEEDMTVDQYVLENLYVTRGGEGQARDASVLQVAFRHTHEEDCQTVLDAIVQSFQEFLNTKYADVNEEAAKLITTAQGEMRTQLVELEEEYRKFQQKSPVYFDQEGNHNLARERYELLETQLSEVSIERSEIASRLELVEASLAKIDEQGGNEFQRLALIDSNAITRIGVIVDVINAKALSDHYLAMQLQPQKLEMARVEYETLLNLSIKERLNADVTGESHPSTQAARKMRKTAEDYLKDKGVEQTFAEPLSAQASLTGLLSPSALVDAYVQILRNDLAALTARQRQLIRFRDAAEAEAKRLIDYELSGAQQRRELDRQVALYDATVERLRDINLAKDFGGYVNEIIAAPNVGDKVWPSLPICLAAAMVLGLCSGSGSALLWELTDKKISKTSDIEDLLDANVLSSIPTIGLSRKELKAAGSHSGISPHIVAHHKPNDGISEAYRGLRTSLLFKAGENQAKIICFTSPQAGDGKTTTCLNIAISAAKAGKRVLVVDGDLRRPNVARQLGIGKCQGFAQYLTGNAELADVVIRDHLTNLDVIPTNTSSKNASELLAGKTFMDFLQSVRSDYDIVLIDCPPVLAVSDPAIVASVADGTVLVVRTNPNSRQQLKGVKAALNDVDAELLGVVVNASMITDSRTGSYGRGYYYGYEYKR